MDSSYIPASSTAGVMTLLSCSVVSRVTTFPSFANVAVSVGIEFNLYSLCVSVTDYPFTTSVVINRPVRLVVSFVYFLTEVRSSRVDVFGSSDYVLGAPSP